MLTFNDYCRRKFGEKIYKISLNAGMTCPTRDGTKGDRGCIFCSAGGSGDFAGDPALSMDEQIEEAKKKVAGKYKGDKYIAYFQAFTNTYASVERLREIFLPIINRNDIVALDIATRPDCLERDKVKLISELNQIKPVIVELGLQTIKEESVKYIRRGYDTAEYDDAVLELNRIGVHVVTHVILGLPGETKSDMLATVQHVVKQRSGGIKLQLLHVLKGTDLAKDYYEGKFDVLSLDEYVDILKDCLKIIPDEMVVHRLTGDGPKKLLIAPLWSGDKKNVLNRIRTEVVKISRINK